MDACVSRTFLALFVQEIKCLNIAQATEKGKDAGVDVEIEYS